MRTLFLLSASGLLLGQAAIKTGPEVGRKVPEFRLQDQQGQWRTFENLRGKKGLVLVFYRSADW